jgi:hypothetical protein
MSAEVHHAINRPAAEQQTQHAVRNLPPPAVARQLLVTTHTQMAANADHFACFSQMKASMVEAKACATSRISTTLHAASCIQLQRASSTCTA